MPDLKNVFEERNIIEQFNNYIATGETEQALDLLLEHVKDKPNFVDIVHLKSRWRALYDARRMGTVSEEDYLKDMNSFISTALEMADEFLSDRDKKLHSLSNMFAGVSDVETLNSVFDFVTNNRIEDAINTLDFLTNRKDSNYADYAVDVKILLSSYKALRDADRKGIKSPSEVDFERNKFVLNLIRIIGEMKDLPKKKIEAKIETERIETSAASYVEESMKQLHDRERSLKNQAIFWYFLGFFSLIMGVVSGMYFLNSQIFANDTNGIIAYKIIKSLFIIILLVAISRYCFLLGKSYMNESLKNADRIHAISFGKFYLQVFGTNIKPEDMKEVFKDWNATKDSAFASLNSSDFDPKLFDILTKFIETVKK